MFPAESPLSTRTMTGGELAALQHAALSAADRSDAPAQDLLVDTMRILACERDWDQKRDLDPREFMCELHRAVTEAGRSVRRGEADRAVRDPSSRADI